MDSAGLLDSLLAMSALAVAAAWLPVPPRLSALLQAACGMGLLLWVSPASLALLAGGSVLAYGAVRVRPWLPAATTVAACLVAGVYLAWMLAAGRDAAAMIDLVRPLGMAFYALRLVHYLVEGGRGRIPTHGPEEFLAYQFFCAALPAGPIHRFEDFLRDHRRRRWDPATFGQGLERILYGLAKIVLVGNYLIGIKLMPHLQAMPAGAGALYGEALALWLPLYVYFSGFSDLAIGVGAAMGLRLRENFHQPFAATSIVEFWQRWHISLGAWCRDYVHAPVLARTRRPLLATAAAMIAIGLWHDLSWHYLLWGLYHAAGIAIFRLWRARVPAPASGAGASLRAVLGWLLTIHFVLFSFAATTAVEDLLRSP